MDRSHMWLLYKRKNNQIWVISERYLRHNVTPISGENELLAFTELMFRNCLLEVILGCYATWPTPTPLDMQLGLPPCLTYGNEPCRIHCTNSTNNSSNNSISSTSASNGLCESDLWTMYLTDQRNRIAQELGVS